MRGYRLGRREAAVHQTRDRILDAARDLVASGGPVSVAAIAAQAGVSRITVYNRFRSRAGLLAELSAGPAPTLPTTAPIGSRELLREFLASACARWVVDPALQRNLRAAHNLPGPETETSESERRLAERLVEEDELRPGCSIKEAEDVIAVLASFAVFDRLHRDGRRSAAAVTEILMRLAGGILAYHP